MSTGPQRFHERELSRAIRAVTKSGKAIETVHISNKGEVTIHVAKERRETTEAPEAA